MFQLSSTPIIPPLMECARAGGFVTFEGRVRDHAEGRAVERLTYEAYPEMAIAEGTRLLEEAKEKFGLLDSRVIHRVGTLEIGEVAVWIGVAAAHRREAFAACEWIIDQLKHRVPIWKHEIFSEGAGVWVGAESVPLEFGLLTQRQELLDEIGPEGQAKLRNARVLLVGVGGLGSASLPYLVGAGVGTLGLVDPDQVELTNLHRQVIYSANETGRLKVDRAAAAASRLNPSVRVETHALEVDGSNVDRLVSGYDVVIDGTDSLEVKFLLNAACRRHQKPLITASIHRFEGHLMTVLPDGPCLRCLFPTQPHDGCVGTCAQVGVLGVVPGLFGVLQALEAIKVITDFSDVLTEDMLLFDLKSLQSLKVKRSLRDGCEGCAGIHHPLNLQVSDPVGVVIDIRELDETPQLLISHIRLPLSRFAWQGWTEPVTFICASGQRSGNLAANLREQGHSQVYSLKGGVERLNSCF
ncbi:MAG TPA: ThiF family adenylyltransferase [Fimbriimonadaceae bacterium]|nr:ThiF family adenylyltransferase [Fimbriimonadaceae bacterium]